MDHSSENTSYRSPKLLDVNNRPVTALYMMTGIDNGEVVEHLTFMDAEINGLEKYITDRYRNTDIKSKVADGAFYEVVFSGKMEQPEKLKTYEEVMMYLDYYGYHIEETTSRTLAFCCLDLGQRPPISETQQEQKEAEISELYAEWSKANEQGCRAQFVAKYGQKPVGYSQQVKQPKLRFPDGNKKRGRGL